ncbi:MAG: hypothetical protein FWC36_04605 [Spirochaetes bacterium]|nr:hypothetical protein [Spirochaetota bacterium]
MSNMKKARDAYKKTSAASSAAQNKKDADTDVVIKTDSDINVLQRALLSDADEAETNAAPEPQQKKQIIKDQRSFATSVSQYVFPSFVTKKTNNSNTDEPKEEKTTRQQPAGQTQDLALGETIRKPEKPDFFADKQAPRRKTETTSFVKLNKVQAEEKTAKLTPENKTASDKDAKKYEKAAKVLLLLGKKEAASVIKHFKPDEIEKIASSLIKIKTIDKDEAAALLKEINKQAFIKETFSGGVETARQMLCAAFGKEKGEQFLYKALPEAREKPFEFLQDLEPHQIKLALKEEPETVVAVVMNYLPPEKSAALLTEYATEEQKKILLRLASGGKIQREVFEQMEKIIKEKVRQQKTVVTQRIDGKSKLANILRFMDVKDEKSIIEDISEFDPDLSKEIEDQVYTIDIVLQISDKDLHKVLTTFSDKEVAVILKGQESEIKIKIFSSLSSTRQELVRQESAYLGIMRKSEVNVAVREFVDYIKHAEKDGAIFIDRPGTAL